MNVRAAEPSEVDHLAQLWFDSWQDAHLEILPAELRRFRTLDSFRDRLHAALPDVRVAGPSGEPLGFSIVKAMSCISSTSRLLRVAQVPRRH